MKRYALLSVFDKKDIERIGHSLMKAGYQIIATEGTEKALKFHDIPSIPSSSMSGNPDALTDCIQTIGFKFSAGILFDRENPSHLQQTEEQQISSIDVVVCNFPPPRDYIKIPENFNIQHVDVGGPLMVRAAATNFKQVLVVTNPEMYGEVANALDKGEIAMSLRKELALSAFEYCREYDLEIIQFLQSFP